MATNEQATSALSRITVQTTLQAFSLVRTGEVLDLGSEYHAEMPFASDSGAFFPFRITRNKSAKDASWGPETAGTSFSNEIVMGATHLGTHFDALCHVQYDGKIFGGATAAEAEGDFGWRSMGIETVKPVLTRGVMLDIAGDRGLEKLPDETEIGLPEVQAALERREITIQQGDAVLIRTGTMLEFGDPSQFMLAQPGLSVDAAVWLYDQGMAVLGADNLSVEPMPFVDWARNLHVEMLYHRGVHLVEWVDLEPLREAGVSTFLFICLPLKLKGSTGSWVRPVAVL